MPVSYNYVGPYYLEKYRQCGFESLSHCAKEVCVHRVLALVGLAIIAIGSGGIVASDVALGGDQFHLPQQQAQMTTFFSNIYIFTNLGVLLACGSYPAYVEIHLKQLFVYIL